MGMLSQLQASRNGGTGTYQSGGTSSFPVTGFPATAYRGNNRRAGGGRQGQPSSMSGLANVAQYSQQHVLLTLAVLIGAGYLFWHLDNRKK